MGTPPTPGRPLVPMTARIEFMCHPELRAAVRERAADLGVSEGAVAREAITLGLAAMAARPTRDAEFAAVAATLTPSDLEDLGVRYATNRSTTSRETVDEGGTYTDPGAVGRAYVEALAPEVRAIMRGTNADDRA